MTDFVISLRFFAVLALSAFCFSVQISLVAAHFYSHGGGGSSNKKRDSYAIPFV